jgi:uncharacterized membrane protein
MQGLHLPIMLEVSGAARIVVLVVLVILAVAAIRNVARLRFFGGRGEFNLEPSDERYIHGSVKFEEYEKAKHTPPHVH